MQFAVRTYAPGAALVLFLLLWASLPARAGALEDGVEAYYQRRFNAAAMHFENALEASPNNWKAHFYLARSLEQLKDYEGAKAEFMVVFKLNPFSKEGRLAKQALMDLSATVAARKHHVDDPAHFKQAARQINAQTSDSKNRYRLHADRRARENLNLAYSRIYSVDQSARNERRSNSWYRRNFYYNNVDEVSNRQYIRTSYLRTDAMRSAALTRLEAAKKSEEVQKSANNLKLLLADGSMRPGGARLRALGTNLYVRNYTRPEDEDVAPEDPVVELRARAKSLRSIMPPGKEMDEMPRPMTLRSMASQIDLRKDVYYHDFKNWSAPPRYHAPPGRASSRPVSTAPQRNSLPAHAGRVNYRPRDPGAYHKFGNW